MREEERKEEEKRGLLFRFNSSANHMVFLCFLAKTTDYDCQCFFPPLPDPSLLFTTRYKRKWGGPQLEASSSSAARQHSSSAARWQAVVFSSPPSNGMLGQPPPLFCGGFACYHRLVYVRPAHSQEQHWCVLGTTQLKILQSFNKETAQRVFTLIAYQNLMVR